MSNQNINSFRSVGAGKTYLSPTDFIVQVDTSAGAVELVLPKIDTILATYTTIQQFMGIRLVDISDNASTNNITLTGFETDNVNGSTNVVLNTNGAGGILTLIGESDWSFQANTTVLSNQLYAHIQYGDGTLSVEVEGGVPPYQYTWEMADIAQTSASSGHYFQYTPPTNTSSVTPTVSTSLTPRFGSIPQGDDGFVGLAKVIVTDAVGNKASDTFLLLAVLSS
jgi:hypothetical protein